MLDTILTALGVFILPLFIYLLYKIEHMETILVEILIELKELEVLAKRR